MQQRARHSRTGPGAAPFVGTAGWAIPAILRGQAPAEGSGLQRYAGVFRAVEINSTFYRPHRRQTFARWRESTRLDFRFSVKLPRALTHDARLRNCEPALNGFLLQVEGLEEKLGTLLAQLPPSLAFEATVADDFFGDLRAQYAGPAVCEPRHPSWFTDEADALMSKHAVARAAADPARHPDAMVPGGWPGLAYWRLHGSPHMYYSAYGADQLSALAAAIDAEPAANRWCVFDNTASGAAAANALALQALLERPQA
jgi:uncharacterized protein YecE (DUF72 family)